MAGFLGNQPPKVPLTSADIADGTITNDDLAGSITDAKISALSASKLTGTIADARFPATLPATSGVNLTALNASNLGSGTVPTARLGTGTASSSTFLRGDQTYAEAGGGAWILIGSQTASGDASLTQTGLSSTYASYMLVCSDFEPSADAAQLMVRLGDSSGVDNGASDYKTTVDNLTSNTSVYNGQNDNSHSGMFVAAWTGNSTGETCHSVIFLGNHDTGYCNIHGTYGNTDNTNYAQGGTFAGCRSAIIALDRVQVLFNAGTIDTGRFSVFGLKHT